MFSPWDLVVGSLLKQKLFNYRFTTYGKRSKHLVCIQEGFMNETGFSVKTLLEKITVTSALMQIHRNSTINPLNHLTLYSKNRIIFCINKLKILIFLIYFFWSTVTLFSGQLITFYNTILITIMQIKVSFFYCNMNNMNALIITLFI